MLKKWARSALMGLTLSALIGAILPVAGAVEITIACGAVGIESRLCREGTESWAAATGHRVRLIQSPNLSNNRLALFQQMLAAGSSDVDLFQIDVIWPGILATHLIDLNPYYGEKERQAHWKALIDNNTIGGELKAIPWFTDIGLLYYRSDLLDKYGLPVPETWSQLASAAMRVIDAEREAGRVRMTGFVFQARAYEGLTCNALEWIASYGGGQILSPGGAIDLHNPRAVSALNQVAGWIGTFVSKGVLTYDEEDARGVFQSGNAVFMRNWPYAWALAQADGSPVKGLVGVAPLPKGGIDGRHAGTLGGWGLAVSRYSKHPALAADLARHLTSEAEQIRRAIAGAFNPTRPAVYRNAAVLAAHPFMGSLSELMDNAVVRPSRIAGERYNQFSTIFWNAVHDILSGRAAAADSLAAAERRLRRLSRNGRW